jgi:hypothetical protein
LSSTRESLRAAARADRVTVAAGGALRQPAAEEHPGWHDDHSHDGHDDDDRGADAHHRPPASHRRGNAVQWITDGAYPPTRDLNDPGFGLLRGA